MKDVRADEILDESLLRRALRLDADELPPSVDAVAIAAAAQRLPSRRALALGAVAAAALVAAGVGALVGIGELVLAWASGGFGDLVLDRAIALAVAVAVPVSGVLGTLASPTTAIVSLAAVAFAIFHERAQEGERIHVGAS